MMLTPIGRETTVSSCGLNANAATSMRIIAATAKTLKTMYSKTKRYILTVTDVIISIQIVWRLRMRVIASKTIASMTRKNASGTEITKRSTEKNVPSEFIADCDYCGERYDIRRNTNHSDVTDCDYCCEECVSEAEKEFRESHALAVISA